MLIALILEVPAKDILMEYNPRTCTHNFYMSSAQNTMYVTHIHVYMYVHVYNVRVHVCTCTSTFNTPTYMYVHVHVRA
jgi:hypothetical protein